MNRTPGIVIGGEELRVEHGLVRSSVVAWWREAAGVVLVLFSRLISLPRTPWENDEFLFLEAVRNWDPSRYHPHPPGYPLYVLLGKAFAFIFGDAFRGLVFLGVLSSVIGFLALARAFRNWIGDPDVAVAGAIIFYFSASMLLHSTLALSDGPAAMFLALTLWAISRIGEEPQDHDRTAISIGVWCSAAIGCRPQMVVPLVPLLIVALWRLGSNRKRLICLGAFTFVSLMWFLPLLDAVGGWQAFVKYQTGQAAYFAAHDAAVSRGARTPLQIATRFLLHPWGSKYVFLPLTACVLLGVRRAWDARRVLLPLALFTVAQMTFELGWMDPADAPRYSLPSMVLVAFVAACGLDVVRRSLKWQAVPLAGALLLATIAFAYDRPVLLQRSHEPSPAVAAAAYANAHYTPDTVILYDGAVRPHAEYLLSRFRLMPIDAGLRELYDKPLVPIVIFSDGATHDPDARVFAWSSSDAYGKLTRNHYRTITLDPVRPAQRYLPGRGVYAIERTCDGQEWRWLAADSTIQLPRWHGREAHLTFRLSADSFFDANRLLVAVNGVPAIETVVRRGVTSTLTVPLPLEEVELHIHAERSFTPATVIHNQDSRVLAVQLLGLETS